MPVYLAYGGQSIALRTGETTIGRHVGCDMRFNDPLISRIHLRIFVNPRGVEVEDAGSRNGTWVNGKQLRARRRLQSRDRIQFGVREAEVQIEDSLEATSVEDDTCEHCGYSWGEFRTALATLPHERITQDFPAIMKRRHRRFRVDLPIIYHSESLEIEAIALNLSRGGVFVQTQVLEPAGTECAITLLIDGAPAVTVKGQVVRTCEDFTSISPPGLGVEFSDVTAEIQGWLDSVMERAASQRPG